MGSITTQTVIRQTGGCCLAMMGFTGARIGSEIEANELWRLAKSETKKGADGGRPAKSANRR